MAKPFPHSLSNLQADQSGRFLRRAEQSVHFWIGDWLLYGEKTYGKTDYEQAIRETCYLLLRNISPSVTSWYG